MALQKIGDKSCHNETDRFICKTTLLSEMCYTVKPYATGIMSVNWLWYMIWYAHYNNGGYGIALNYCQLCINVWSHLVAKGV